METWSCFIVVLKAEKMRSLKSSIGSVCLVLL